MAYLRKYDQDNGVWTDQVFVASEILAQRPDMFPITDEEAEILIEQQNERHRREATARARGDLLDIAAIKAKAGVPVKPPGGEVTRPAEATSAPAQPEPMPAPAPAERAPVEPVPATPKAATVVEFDPAQPLTPEQARAKLAAASGPAVKIGSIEDMSRGQLFEAIDELNATKGLSLKKKGSNDELRAIIQDARSAKLRQAAAARNEAAAAAEAE